MDFRWDWNKISFFLLSYENHGNGKKGSILGLRKNFRNFVVFFSSVEAHSNKYFSIILIDFFTHAYMKVFSIAGKIFLDFPKFSSWKNNDLLVNQRWNCSHQSYFYKITSGGNSIFRMKVNDESWLPFLMASLEQFHGMGMKTRMFHLSLLLFTEFFQHCITSLVYVSERTSANPGNVMQMCKLCKFQNNEPCERDNCSNVW